MNILVKVKNEGKKVVGYGATSKSTTVTNYFGISSELVEAIYDTSQTKHYTFSPGAKIPVLPYQEFRERDPDFILLFAWNHAKEIMEKEKDYVNGNKKWIMYVPEAKILND